jgi:hypothetical protein
MQDLTLIPRGRTRGAKEGKAMTQRSPLTGEEARSKHTRHNNRRNQKQRRTMVDEKGMAETL